MLDAVPSSTAEKSHETIATLSMLGFDGVDDLDFFGAWSVLYKAQESGRTRPEYGRIASRIIAPSGHFRTASGLVIRADFDMEQEHGPDVLIIPGGSGAVAAAQRSDLQRHLLAMRATGTRFYTVCSGCLFLAACGLLQGMQVAMHAGKHELLADAGCERIVSGLHHHDWLTSVGGARASSVKSVELAFKAIEDICPMHVRPLRDRMEIESAYL
jgi:putative intracellular protease/amidase